MTSLKFFLNKFMHKVALFFPETLEIVMSALFVEKKAMKNAINPKVAKNDFF